MDVWQALEAHVGAAREGEGEAWEGVLAALQALQALLSGAAGMQARKYTQTSKYLNSKYVESKY